MLRSSCRLTTTLTLLVAVTSTGWAQTRPLVDTLQPAIRPQLNTLPLVRQPGGPANTSLASPFVRERPSRLTGGLSLGWGAPYAVGAELAYRWRPAVDSNVGVGVGASGAKIGAGVRGYLPSRTRNQVFVGTNVVYSYADTEVELEVNGIKGRYRMHSSMLWHLRAGLHHQFRRHALQVALGYGTVLVPRPVIELVPGYGPGSATMRKIVEIVGPGGPEVSLTFLVGLGRSKVVLSSQPPLD
ncbi:hypothetical protein [Hymenobacter sp. YC55]|uniref:hypothetical protein n=1 Tax=Hymenobacter sp. YC55 TaxID=3034019 RepID=UPI0023F7274F|nr:hypothetical protein [Hymenobacter sp. YC55]MDF7815903.1 hypothetical protein [Hymenobacter sp. YC55]